MGSYQMDQRTTNKAISRSSILHGYDDCEYPRWFDLDQCLEENLYDTFKKLDGLDDDIWGKIIIMERNVRVAKAYLRQTVITVNGGERDFDGITIGFKAFQNPLRDRVVEEMRNRIGQGLRVRVELQGDLLAKRFCNGPVTVYSPCVAQTEKTVDDESGFVRMRLPEGNRGIKVFDMRKFKRALEADTTPSSEEKPQSIQQLMLRTVVAFSVARESSQLLNTPCWFFIINLIALDMIHVRAGRLHVPYPIKELRDDTGNSSTLQSNKVASQERAISSSMTDLTFTVDQSTGNRFMTLRPEANRTHTSSAEPCIQQQLPITTYMQDYNGSNGWTVAANPSNLSGYFSECDRFTSEGGIVQATFSPLAIDAMSNCYQEPGEIAIPRAQSGAFPDHHDIGQSPSSESLYGYNEAYRNNYNQSHRHAHHQAWTLQKQSQLMSSSSSSSLKRSSTGSASDRDGMLEVVTATIDRRTKKGSMDSGFATESDSWRRNVRRCSPLYEKQQSFDNATGMRMIKRGKKKEHAALLHNKDSIIHYNQHNNMHEHREENGLVTIISLDSDSS